LEAIIIACRRERVNTPNYDENLKFKLKRIQDKHTDPKMQNFKLMPLYLNKNLTFNKTLQIFVPR
jgi:hypothetical protein